MSLFLHAGAQHVTLEEVRAVPTPDSTETWFPVPHSTVIDAIKTGLADHSNFNVVSEEYGLWADGARLFGLLGIQNGDQADDYQLNIGFRNSNDKAFSLGYAFGNRVFVCDNLVFSGEVTFKRKHTRFARRDLFLDDRVASYKRTELADHQVHDLLIKSVDAQVIANAGIAKVLREWRASDHEEFAPRTAWSLHNAYTEVFKGSNPVDVTARSLRLHGLLDSVAAEVGNDPRQTDLLVEDTGFELLN